MEECVDNYPGITQRYNLRMLVFGHEAKLLVILGEANAPVEFHVQFKNTFCNLNFVKVM